MASVATLRDLLEALVESAREGGKLHKVLSDVENLFKVVNNYEEVREILGSPAYDVEKRKELVKEMAQIFNFDSLTVNFVSLIIELGRFKAFLRSQEPVIRRLIRASGRIRADIIVARSLSESELNTLKESIKKLTGSEVDVSVKVDPTILGGIIAKIEDRVFDSSVKTQLERTKMLLST